MCEKAFSRDCQDSARLCGRTGFLRTFPVPDSRFWVCWIDPRAIAESNKPLRPHLALCENQAGMAQTGKALDCYLVPDWNRQTSSARKSSGVQIPLPALGHPVTGQVDASPGTCSRKLSWRVHRSPRAGRELPCGAGRGLHSSHSLRAQFYADLISSGDGAETCRLESIVWVKDANGSPP